MIRSRYAIARLLVIPNLALLALYVLMTGLGGVVLTLPLQRKESPRWWKRLKKIYPA
ncbi:MAG: hypothetical protein KDI01_11255 [Halioglobus sp.]|nr:hypothetical protein [Halioglobus sp.]